MKTSIFDMSFTLPPMIEMTEVEKDNPKLTGRHSNCKGDGCQETDMKTSIFDMSFTLPPMLEMIGVEKDMPTACSTAIYVCTWVMLCQR